MSQEEVIRAKGILDGATTLEEAITMVQEFAVQLEKLKQDGYELTEPIEDDYGFVEKA